MTWGVQQPRVQQVQQVQMSCGSGSAGIFAGSGFFVENLDFGPVLFYPDPDRVKTGLGFGSDIREKTGIDRQEKHAFRTGPTLEKQPRSESYLSWPKEFYFLTFFRHKSQHLFCIDTMVLILDGNSLSSAHVRMPGVTSDKKIRYNDFLIAIKRKTKLVNISTMIDTVLKLIIKYCNVRY